MIPSINALDIESIASEKCGVDSAARYTTLNLPSGLIQGHPSDQSGPKSEKRPDYSDS